MLSMEKNKAAYKLKGICPIYYLNLDGQPERRQNVETQFEYWEIENYERISAYDGRSDDLSHILVGRYPEISSGEVGCVTSHLKAIRHWLDTSDSDHAIFCEDDVDLEPVKYWPFNWKEFYSYIPYDWDVIQLAVINPRKLLGNLHPRLVDDFSTAAYMINRRYAEKLMHFHVKGVDKYKLDNGVRPRAVADDLIYNAGKTYSIPVFVYRLDLGSTIHPEHVDAFHTGSRNGLMEWWQNESNKMSVESFFHFEFNNV
jgi:hypothetical protein